MIDELGRQKDGSSPAYTKQMALAAKDAAIGSSVIPVALDIGAGAGELTRLLLPISRRVIMLDFYAPRTLPDGATFIQSDLNREWPLEDDSVDFAFAIEVIEHVENPRHFVREVSRVLRPGGFGFLSTPNNHSLASKLTFLFRDQHRMFQDPSYPGHITALLQSDLLRVLTECALRPFQWFYSNSDTLPVLHWQIRLRGRPFSNCLGILFSKPID